MVVGTLTGDCGHTSIRTLFLKDFYVVVVVIKRLFDPAGIFNGDKKVGVTTGDWEGWVR